MFICVCVPVCLCDNTEEAVVFLFVFDVLRDKGIEGMDEWRRRGGQ